MAEKFTTTRLSPLRVTVMSKQFNKRPKKIIQEGIDEFEKTKQARKQVPIVNPVFSLLPLL